MSLRFVWRCSIAGAVVLAAVLQSGCPSKPKDFGRTVVVDGMAGASVMQVVQDDLIPLTGKVTGTPFALATGAPLPARAIFVVLAGNLSQYPAPAAVTALAQQLQGTSPQSYVLHAEAKGSAWVVSSTGRGLMHGIYELLERMGVTFLMPGESWTHFKSNPEPGFTVALKRVPVFNTLDYFGTNGREIAGAVAPLNSAGNGSAVDKEWKTWKRRNRFPYQYRLDGHSWEDFTPSPSFATAPGYDSTMWACLACPAGDLACAARPQDDLCPDQGTTKFRRVGPATRYNPTHHGRTLCGTAAAPVPCLSGQTPTVEDMMDFTTNAGLAGQYTDYRLGWLSQQVAAIGGDASVEPFVSVDPADGTAFCRCQKCVRMLRNGAEGITLQQDATVEDSVFHLGNHVARHARQAHPKAHVNMYAYASRANPPSIPLETNLFPILIPYHFYSGQADALIDAWVAKRASNPKGKFRMGIYDYWAMPQWKNDKPVIAVKEVALKMRRWAQADLEAIYNESTYGNGAAGLAWYVASRLAWDTTVDEVQLQKEWYQKAFGTAAGPMEKLYPGFWDKNGVVDASTLAPAFANLKAAEGLLAANDPAWARLTDLEGYVEYLRLYFEFNSAPAGAQKDAARDALLPHVWCMAPTGMLHSSYLWTLLRAGDPGWEPGGAKLNAVPGSCAINKASMSAAVAAGVAKYPM